MIRYRFAPPQFRPVMIRLFAIFSAGGVTEAA
jgi:hypothetical protein